MPRKNKKNPPSLQVTTEKLEWLSGPELSAGKDLLRLWHNTVRDGVVHMQDLTPRLQISYMKNTVIWESVDSWKDARVRLMGENLKLLFGADIKGHLMSEVFSHLEKPQHIAMLRTSMGQCVPTSVKSQLWCQHVKIMELEIFSAPVFDDDSSQMLAMVHVQPYPAENRDEDPSAEEDVANTFGSSV